jgi:GH25 family lysozyme M1 (1,4-beta-N-acetylmuramidase)
VASATVRDVEANAWTPLQAVNAQPWTPVRPTIYCSLDTLPALEQAGWQGDVWVAHYIAAPPTAPPPMPPGMRCVAQQWTDQGGGGAYDLSVVFDPTWPAAEESTVIRYADGEWLTFTEYVSPSGVRVVTGLGTDATVWQSVSPDGKTWTKTQVAK